MQSSLVISDGWIENIFESDQWHWWLADINQVLQIAIKCFSSFAQAGEKDHEY